MDNKDAKIVSILKDNCRLSIREISKKTQIRPSTVHQRIARLKKGNIIEKFTLKLSNKAIGENFIVFMLVKTKPATILGHNIVSNKYVKEILGVTGEYDVIMKLKFKDVEEFNNFVLSFRKEQKIESTLTMIATANVKEELN